jgi:hypothetical protein
MRTRADAVIKILCLFREVKGSQNWKGYRKDTEMPQTPFGEPASLNMTGACTQIAAEQEEGADAPGHRLNTGHDAGDFVCVGSSFDASKAVVTAFTAFVVAEFAPLQVAQYGAAPARAPSCAARVIAP